MHVSKQDKIGCGVFHRRGTDHSKLAFKEQKEYSVFFFGRRVGIEKSLKDDVASYQTLRDQNI